MELVTHTDLMTDPSTPAQQPLFVPAVDQGMSIPLAVAISVVSVIAAAGASYGVISGRLSAGMTRVLAVVALLALVALFYGVIELTLAVIATTAERRRKAREVTERRTGARARKPKE